MVKVAHFGSAEGVFLSEDFLRVLLLGCGGVGGEIDHGFAGEDFVLEVARGELLVFARLVISVLEFHGLNFKLGEGEFALLRGEITGELPVARHGRNGPPSEIKSGRNSNNNNDIIKNENVVFEVVNELARTRFDFIHKLIITCCMMGCRAF